MCFPRKATRSTQSAPSLAGSALDLTGRTALVTGAGRGIGAAAARRLAEAGARVALAARSRDELEALAAELPHEPVVLVSDLGGPEAAGALLDDALDTLGRLDVLVNNAGAFHAGPSHLLTAADVDDLLALNLRAPLLLAGAAAERMARDGGGSIIQVSSAVAALGTSPVALYSASKGALDAATRALAHEWGPAGVRVNAVAPGVTRSAMTAGLVDDPGFLEHFHAHVPLRRVGEPEDVAGAVHFLASGAAAYVTGQVLVVDGGWATTGSALPG